MSTYIIFGGRRACLAPIENFTFSFKMSRFSVAFTFLLFQESKPENSLKKQMDPISSKTGGAYIPPAMLKLMQASITDKASTEYQRISWEALKKSIHGLINKVNRTNIDKIIRQLLKENIGN